MLRLKALTKLRPLKRLLTSDNEGRTFFVTDEFREPIDPKTGKPITNLQTFATKRADGTEVTSTEMGGSRFMRQTRKKLELLASREEGSSNVMEFLSKGEHARKKEKMAMIGMPVKLEKGKKGDLKTEFFHEGTRKNYAKLKAQPKGASLSIRLLDDMIRNDGFKILGFDSKVLNIKKILENSMEEQAKKKMFDDELKKRSVNENIVASQYTAKSVDYKKQLPVNYKCHNEEQGFYVVGLTFPDNQQVYKIFSTRNFKTEFVLKENVDEWFENREGYFFHSDRDVVDMVEFVEHDNHMNNISNNLLARVILEEKRRVDEEVRLLKQNEEFGKMHGKDNNKVRREGDHRRGTKAGAVGKIYKTGKLFRGRRDEKSDKNRDAEIDRRIEERKRKQGPKTRDNRDFKGDFINHTKESETISKVSVERRENRTDGHYVSTLGSGTIEGKRMKAKSKIDLEIKEKMFKQSQDAKKRSNKIVDGIKLDGIK